MSKIVVLIPCFNEALTIGKVVDDFKNQIPNADIYVYDNNSTDNTVDIARQHGAIVVHAPIQGKGAVVKQMFNEIDADVYLMVDGDATYPARYAPMLINEIENGCDMMLGDRLSANYFESNKRPFHNIGNKLVCYLVNKFYKGNVSDVMTGYRAFSKSFVECIKKDNILSNGFEIETEMTIYALKRGYLIKSIPIEYKERPKGSNSKLRTFTDGRKILHTIVKLQFS